MKPTESPLKEVSLKARKEFRELLEQRYQERRVSVKQLEAGIISLDLDHENQGEIDTYYSPLIDTARKNYYQLRIDYLNSDEYGCYDYIGESQEFEAAQVYIDQLLEKLKGVSDDKVIAVGNMEEPRKWVFEELCGQFRLDLRRLKTAHTKRPGEYTKDDVEAFDIFSIPERSIISEPVVVLDDMTRLQ